MSPKLGLRQNGDLSLLTDLYMMSLCGVDIHVHRTFPLARSHLADLKQKMYLNETSQSRSALNPI